MAKPMFEPAPAASTSDTAVQYLPLSKVFAVGIGNALEFYDFMTFSYFAVQIGHCFFPTSQTAHGLLFSLATFGVGFITRPLGAIVIGRLGDRVGRKPAMIFSFLLMGIGLLGLALTPSYAQIGTAAPILLLLFRLLQGFALGGEVGPSTAYLIEAAPPQRRGLYVAVQYMTQDLAVMLAGLIGFILSNALTPDALDAWGWRVAFLLGTVLVPFGLIFRHTLPETLQPADRLAPAAHRALPTRLLLLGVPMLMASTIGGYGLSYITTYAQDTLHMTANAAFGATILTGFCGACGDLLSGFLSDRIGRKPVMIGGVLLMTACVMPAYILMNQTPSLATVYSVTAILCLLATLFANAALITITESLPKAIRSSVLSTLYAVTITVFGGTTQLVIKALTDATGDPLAPGWYISGALAIGTVAMVLAPESAPVKTGRA